MQNNNRWPCAVTLNIFKCMASFTPILCIVEQFVGIFLTQNVIFFLHYLSKSGQTLNIKSSEAIVKTIQNI